MIISLNLLTHAEDYLLNIVFVFCLTDQNLVTHFQMIQPKERKRKFWGQMMMNRRILVITVEVIDFHKLFKSCKFKFQ
jgi:hypothetical protein